MPLSPVLLVMVTAIADVERRLTSPQSLAKRKTR